MIRMSGMFQPDMRLWPKVVVINWVKNLDPSLAEYMHLFVEHDITGDRLLNMTHDDLVRIGIDKVGPQAILLEAVDSVKRLNSSYMEADTLQLHIYQLSVSANCLVQSIQAYITLTNQIDSNPMERALYEHDKGRYQLDYFTALVELVEAAKEAVSWLCRVPFYSSLNTEATRLLQSIQQSVGNIVCAFSNNSEPHQGKALQEIKEQSLKLNTTCEKYVTGFKDPLAVVPCQLELVHIKRNPGDNKWGLFDCQEEDLETTTTDDDSDNREAALPRSSSEKDAAAEGRLMQSLTAAEWTPAIPGRSPGQQMWICETKLSCVCDN